jgi:hypothetical protein
MFTDGFADQFGGDKNKKYNISRFRELILSISGLPMDQQKNQLDKAFESWMGNNEQIDDVLVIGLRRS